MKRNQSALAAACVVAVLTLSGCAGNRSWMPWGESRADGAARSDQGVTLEHGRHGRDMDMGYYRPLDVHEPR